MIKEIKLGIRMLRYAHGLKSNILIGILLLAAGTAACVWGRESGAELLGEYIFIWISVLPAQLLFSLSASNMLQASPMKKKMQTTVPALITWVCMMTMYLLVTAVRAVWIWFRPEEANHIGSRCIITALFMMLVMIYIGIAYKYFLISVIMMVLVMLFLNGGMENMFGLGFFGINGSGMNGPDFVPAAALGIGFLAVGFLLQYLVSLLLYKAPLSKMALAAPLRREL